MSIGPTRLVLIRSGKYEFGDIELIRPLHLIGPNNVGKTSLISTLQFLYIDQQQKMHFTRDMDQTRRYYFPDPDSYILFECLSPTGYRVLGVHGLGPLKSYAFERFSYSGELQLEDFIDSERRVRPNNEIKLRLSDREYTVLEPSHLKASLTGIGENKGVRLELLPMRDRGGYNRFRKVFSNLLRLAHISQEDLKRFLFEIYESDFQQSSIDLESSYSSQYQKVKTLANEVKDLKAVSEVIHNALTLAEERDTLRSELPQIYQKIIEGVESAIDEKTKIRSELKERRNKIAIQINENEKKQQDVQLELRKINESVGVLKTDIRRLEEQKKSFESYLPSFELPKINKLKEEFDDIQYSLKSSSAEQPRRIENRIKSNQTELLKQKDLLQTVAYSAVNHLKENFQEDEIKRLFSLFNHDILGMAVKKGEIDITNAENLHKNLVAILSRTNNEEFSDHSITIKFSQYLQPDLSKYSDPKVITSRIEDLEAELEKDEKILEASKKSEQLRKRKDEIEGEVRKLEKRYNEYLDLQNKCDLEKSWRQELAIAEKQQRNLELEQQELAKKSNTYQSKDRDCARKISHINEEEDQLNYKIRALTPPSSQWMIKEQISLPTLSLTDLFEEYDSKYSQEKRKAENLSDKLEIIESKTYSRTKGENEAETLELLAEELDGLTQKEEAVEKLWSGLTANLQTAIKNMLKDLDTLRSRVEQLNRQLGKVSVSNLSRLKLMLAENLQLVPRLNAVASRSDAPLFAGLQNTDEALSFIGEFLKNSGKIDLLQLFELNFEVTIADGTPQKYTKLETIESNGTTITIKVLINLMLLRGLIDEKRSATIPFYLDEASSLDRDNVKSIVDQSVKMGFTPILASPEAMDIADHLYFLKDRDGRLLLEKNALIRISKRQEVEVIHA